ncbi:MAG TPA: flagellar export chaperone FliS [Burkholderiales bacterium]|nr:flagellar export chaperone FliS [Burkholderiales bacterium]
MFGTTRPGVNAYMDINLETGVFAASPHKLIVMLFDGAKMALSNARSHLENKKIAAKGRAISHAIRIISDGLRASLNKEAGGPLAKNLDALYEYMCKRLVLANLNNDEKILQEVIDLVDVIRQAWMEIEDSPSSSAASFNAPMNKSMLDTLAPRPTSFIKA